MSIGKNIYDLRKERGFTQSTLAGKLGVSEQAVSKWENEVCAPDLSLFPTMAKLFGVSIDRIFGFHLDTYENEINEIIKASDESYDTYKEIEILSGGLEKYPNSDRIKIALAFSLSMVNRISKDKKERDNAVKRAVTLCNEVVDTSVEPKHIDSALNMLWRIYVETDEYEKALAAIDKISADSYSSRITGKAAVLSFKNDLAAQKAYVQNEMFECWHSMALILSGLVASLRRNKEYEKALAYNAAQRNLLSVFDGGDATFYIAYKAQACIEAAMIYRDMNDREKCLCELRTFAAMEQDMNELGALLDGNYDAQNIAGRNSLFAETTKGIHEEYYSKFPREMLEIFNKYFSGDAEFEKIKNGE